MRNKLLITTALVALLGVSNAYALEIGGGMIGIGLQVVE